MLSHERKSVKDNVSETPPRGAIGIGLSIETRKKILVIDDDLVTVKALTIALNGEGCAIYSAANSSETISVVRKENPDMLLVDVNLQEIPASGREAPWDGFQLTRWLQHVSAKNIPSILISASDKADYKKYAEMIGAEAFMAKPLNDAMLFQSIESALVATNLQ